MDWIRDALREHPEMLSFLPWLLVIGSDNSGSRVLRWARLSGVF
jgi:hypothetical protein